MNEIKKSLQYRIWEVFLPEPLEAVGFQGVPGRKKTLRFCTAGLLILVHSYFVKSHPWLIWLVIIYHRLKTIETCIPSNRLILPALVIAVILMMALWLVKEVKQLQSLAGITVFILYLYVSSKHPDKVRDWSLITGRAGYKMGKSRVQNLLCTPLPPQDMVKPFAPPPFGEWKLFVPPPPPSIWLKLQATA